MLTTGWSDYQALELSRAALIADGVGEKHPRILNIDSQLKLRMDLLLDAVEVHKRALKTQLSMAEQQFLNSKETKEKTWYWYKRSKNRNGGSYQPKRFKESWSGK